MAKCNLLLVIYKLYLREIQSTIQYIVRDIKYFHNNTYEIRNNIRYRLPCFGIGIITEYQKCNVQFCTLKIIKA